MHARALRVGGGGGREEEEEERRRMENGSGLELQQLGRDDRNLNKVSFTIETKDHRSIYMDETTGS